MFADVKGSTEIVSIDDPERASEWLEHILDVMRNAVHRFGGTVTRVQGDGVMALFGAPVEYEDHCVRACAAALAMLNDVNREPPGPRPAFKIRIGIASGELMTLPVASDTGINYDAMGAVVHLAARLEQAATPNTALISSETQQGTRDAFDVQEKELSGLRGLPATVQAFELTRWSARHGVRPTGHSARPHGIFVDREEAFATLRSALAGLGRKRSRVVFVTGEPGIGKSRLIVEFLASVHDDVRVCVSQSSPYRSFAYGPLADLVADLAGIETDTKPDERRNRLAALTGRGTQATEGVAGELDILVDVNSNDFDVLSLAPIDRRLRVEAAAVALFAAVSQEKPLILLIEDVHWLDEDDLGQLARICERIRGTQCLVLLTARDAWVGPAALWEQSDHQCRIAPLEPAHVRQLFDALVRPGRGTAVLSNEIVERTSGNPLFIEETLHALHQAEALTREDHFYSLRQPGVDIPLSPTVRGLLASRIDRLEHTQKDVLRAIAVIGQSATPAVLQALLGLDANIVNVAIERLIALDLLTIDTPPEQPFAAVNLQFRHPLAREVAYEQTLLRDRARIHQWMLVRLEEEERSGLRDRSDILAEHAFRAEAWEKAARYMLRAGSESFWRDAKTEAVRFLRRGLEAVERSDSDQADSLISLQLHLELRNSLFQLARMDELAHHLSAARPAALKLSHPVHTGRYHIFQSHYYWFTGDLGGALDEAEAARTLAASSGLNALESRARFQRGLVEFSRGEHRDAIESMNNVSSAIIGQEPKHEFGMNKSLLVTTLGYSARAHAELGQVSEAREHAARSLAVARELNNQFAWVFAYVAEGWVNFHTDAPDRALPFLERAYEICATEDVPLMGPVSGSFLSLALLSAANSRAIQNVADRKRSLTLAEHAVKQGNEFQFWAFQPMRVAILSQALLANGQNKAALDQAKAALEDARRQEEPVSEVEALLALSQAQRSLEMDWEATLRAAASIAERLEMNSALMRCARAELRCREPYFSF
jgi:class 3 adenylate cyclase